MDTTPAAFNHLIKWGANVNAKGGDFGTALHAAAAGGQEIMVKCLVNREASLALTDAVGRTPLYLANAIDIREGVMYFMLAVYPLVDDQECLRIPIVPESYPSGLSQFVCLSLPLANRSSSTLSRANCAFMKSFPEQKSFCPATPSVR